MVQLQETKYGPKETKPLQRIACVAITGAIRNLPTTAMEVILDLIPLS